MKTQRGAAPSQQTPSIQSLDRGLTILEAVAKSGRSVSLGELTELLKIDRSSVFRLAGTLKRRGFLANPAGRKDYVLGPSLWRLAHQYDWSNMLVKVSHEQLENLATETNETAQLAVREGRQALFIDSVVTSHVISISGRAGELTPLHCTAHGKALLADFTLNQLEAVFSSASPLKRYTKKTVSSIKQLAGLCAETKARGFAVDDEEYVEGIRCVAAPIRAQDGPVVGAIGISAPLARFPDERYNSCGKQVLKTAARITALLTNQSAE